MSTNLLSRPPRGLPLGLGIAGIVACVIGAIFNPVQFFRSYLIGYVFWAGIALGCLAILMLYHMVGGRWGFLVRRILEAASRTFPMLAVLFLPILFGARDLYLWARPDAVRTDPILAAKAGYLNVPFFAIRTGILFAVWIGLAHFLNRGRAGRVRRSIPRRSSSGSRRRGSSCTPSRRSSRRSTG
jgi:hypothetical protein